MEKPKKIYISGVWFLGKSCLFDQLRNDLENYYNWKLMNAVPRLKATANLYITDNRDECLPPKKRIKTCEQILQEKENLILPTDIPSSSGSHNTINFEVVLQVDANTQTEKLLSKDKYIMAKPIMEDKMTSFQKKDHGVKSPSLSMFSKSSSSISIPTLFICSEVDSSSTCDVDQDLSGRLHKLKLIRQNSKFYLGLPDNFYWILTFIHNNYQPVINELSLIITLFKIKQNDSMLRIAEEFQLPEHTVLKEFFHGISILASFFLNFIYFPDSYQLKKNLPLAFKIKYSNVQCIIDCFEIQIEKPSNPTRQAQTWSQYKNCNTIKYLISCTPSGFINFISKGYGGRISDKAIVEKSGFIDALPHKAVILADRGFKEIEVSLMTKGAKLLRPPSVSSGGQLSRHQVMESKVIASLRVHIERVIRRVREFRFLKPHSVIQHKHIKIADHAVIIACGLANLQEPIIKSE